MFTVYVCEERCTIHGMVRCDHERTIVVGDVHGCYDEALELLSACGASERDRIVFLGDLIDRGPEPARCIDLAMSIAERQVAEACIMGNHEERHVFYRDIERLHGSVNVHVADHVATRSKLTDAHHDYIRNLPLFIRLPEHNAVCVHAGVWPGRPIERQKKKHLLHVQMIDPTSDDGSERSMWASRVHGKPGWTFWSHLWDGPERVIFGHSVLTAPIVTDRVVGLDGGGVFGGELWAFIIPGDELIRVKCRGEHDPKVLAQRGNPSKKPFPIVGDVATY